MRNRRRSFVTALTILASLIFFIGSLVINEHATAQGGDKDCEALKKEITDLQQTLVDLTTELNALQHELDAADQGWERWKNSPAVKKVLQSSAYSEEYKGELLDAGAQWLNLRRALRKDIETNKASTQKLKDTIADLLNKLGDCGKRTTPTPRPTPAPTPTPTPSPAPKNTSNQVGYQVDTKTANGLFVTTFDTPQGKIKVNLTDDVAAGDTISGTVETEPAGKNDAERAQNQAELNGYVVELEGQRTKVGDKKITCKIPTTLTPEAKTIVLQHNGQTVATTEIPISATPPPTPNTFTLPTGGQQGRPIVIHGPCDGVFSPQDHVKVGPTILPPVAESPRSLIVQNTSDVVGPTNIECNENGVAMQCPFRNIGIKLSAPKLNLQRGETTTLHVVVMGLAGVTGDVPLDLVNNSPMVISMSGGETQHIVIHSTQVQPDGTSALDRTLTGNTTGGFNVTAMVTWTGVCKQP